MHANETLSRVVDSLKQSGVPAVQIREAVGRVHEGIKNDIIERARINAQRQFDDTMVKLSVTLDLDPNDLESGQKRYFEGIAAPRLA